MEEVGEQNKHLVLANNIFLLTHPDVDDIEKVRIRDDVFAAIKSDGNPSFSLFSTSFRSSSYWVCFTYAYDVATDMLCLYESLCNRSILEMDSSVVEQMKKRIEEEIKKLDEKYDFWDLF